MINYVLLCTRPQSQGYLKPEEFFWGKRSQLSVNIEDCDAAFIGLLK